MLEVFLDALKDSAIILASVFVINIIVSFFEAKLAEKFAKNKTLSPLLGASIGLIPQCGFSIVASDLYIKEKITLGTLIAVFVACSDEALPILIANPNKAIMILPLLGSKLLIGFIFGLLIDFVIRRSNKPQSFDASLGFNIDEPLKGCCNHNIEEKEITKMDFVKSHLVHPLIHSLKIFVYVFVINMIFGTIVHYVGEDKIASFLNTNYFLTPLFSSLIGLIPNCASSVIITELFVSNKICFGACLSGLICNAGLGLIYLLKNKKSRKDILIIVLLLVGISLLSGYTSAIIEYLIK